MPKSRITINDIARMANISPSAVSIVLNNKPGVSESTRELVQKIIRETNYTPNLNSQKLILNKSFNIYVVVESRFAAFDNMFYNSAILGVLEVCRRYNYNVVLTDIDGTYINSSLKQAIEQKNIDGAIFLQDIQPETAEALKKAGCPFVILDAHELRDDIPCVYSDYAAGTEQGVDYLIQNGHRKIALFGAAEIPAYYMAGIHGYLAALEKADIKCHPGWIIPTSPDKASVEESVGKLLSCEERPDALFCCMDMIALYTMQSLLRRGLSLPQDMSVCSIDNIVSAQFCMPALTTVDIEKKEMGKSAAGLLYDLIHQKSKDEIHLHICTPIGKTVVRDSVLQKF